MAGVLRWLRTRIEAAAPTRESGLPTSSNRASSMHLYWEAPPRPLAEVAVTVTVVEPPTVPRLYFWALQASFETDGGRTTGAAHLGLQHHPGHPGGGAVNWGGYHRGGSGGVLDGSVSALPSALDNPNTRDYPWLPRRPYRYRIHRSPGRGWRGSVTDLATGATTVVRDLWVEGDHLMAPMVWTEAFADCGEPPAAVGWTDLEAVTVDGRRATIHRVRVNYQSHAEGGCTNTDCSSVDGGFLQRTGVRRRTPVGAVLTA